MSLITSRLAPITYALDLKAFLIDILKCLGILD